MSAVCRPPMDLTTGIQKAKKRSAGTCGGRSSALACGAIGTGHATAAKISAPIATHIVGAGGSRSGRASRLTWSQKTAAMASGTPMCANRLRKKNALGSGSSPVNARLTGSESIGRASRIRAPSCARYWPRTSHTIT